jgi:hypothetical protein
MKRTVCLVLVLVFFIGFGCSGGGGGGSDDGGGAAPAPGTVRDQTELLRGSWHFYFTIISTWHEYYYLTTIPGDTNSQGGYWIEGTDQWGDYVNATYWPDDGNWSLLDTGTIIDQFYAFYTDGTNILDGSCYYQIDLSDGSWSNCYTLYGDKFSSSMAVFSDRSFTEQIITEEIRLKEIMQTMETMSIQGDQETVDESIKQKYREMK